MGRDGRQLWYERDLPDGNYEQFEQGLNSRAGHSPLDGVVNGLGFV